MTDEERAAVVTLLGVAEWAWERERQEVEEGDDAGLLQNWHNGQTLNCVRATFGFPAKSREDDREISVAEQRDSPF